MTDSLRSLLEQDKLRPLDYHFARFVAEGSGEPEDGVLAHSAALLSWRAGQGDVCVDLGRISKDERFGPLTDLPADVWRRQLSAAAWVGDVGERHPLILQGERLYLYKYQHFEECVARHVLGRLQHPPKIDHDRLHTGLNRLFDATQQDPLNPGKQSINWQRVAAAIAVQRRFAVISGGPGTGKTTTVVKVLALLLEQAPEMRIALAAPTGKAAARLAESIRNGLTGLQSKLDADIRGRVPTRAATIHRLLRPMQGRFRHNRGNPLLIDCLVLDEASMIDLPLMARLLDALPESTRVVLLGDRDQLSSVEAGSVLSDISGRGAEISFSNAFATSLAETGAAPLAKLPVNSDGQLIGDAIALLKIGYRFSADSGIGLLAGLVNQEQGAAALDALHQGAYTDIAWMQAGAPATDSAPVDWAVEHFTPYLSANDVQQALSSFEQARVLCAMRQGPDGVTALNERITRALVRRGLAEDRPDYRGRPILITRNDYASGLFNGDIGLLWPDAGGITKAWFADAEGDPEAGQALRAISLHRLPQHETAYCLSVHKSQGSEFDQVLLVLPSETNAVVSRELLYTGITRAKRALTVYAVDQVFLDGCATATQRASGLAEKLGWKA